MPRAVALYVLFGLLTVTGLGCLQRTLPPGRTQQALLSAFQDIPKLPASEERHRDFVYGDGVYSLRVVYFSKSYRVFDEEYRRILDAAGWKFLRAIGELGMDAFSRGSWQLTVKPGPGDDEFTVELFPKRQ